MITYPTETKGHPGVCPSLTKHFCVEGQFLGCELVTILTKQCWPSLTKQLEAKGQFLDHLPNVMLCQLHIMPTGVRLHIDFYLCHANSYVL